MRFSGLESASARRSEAPDSSSNVRSALPDSPRTADGFVSTGKAARRVAKYRPAQMILAATPSEKVYHQLALVWGVTPLRTQSVDSVDVLFHCAIENAKARGYLSSGDTVVMTAGIPLNTHGSTNMVKVQTIR